MPRYNNLIENLGVSTSYCSGLGIGEQGSVLTNFKSALVFCPNTQYAQNLELQLNALNKPCCCVLNFNKPFTLSTFSSQEYKLDVLRALNMLASENGIVLTTAKFATCFLPNLKDFKANTLTLNKGGNYNLNQIQAELARLGYKKTESVNQPGEFAIRGDILDVFTPTDANPIRLDFFDVELENLYFFDFLSYEKLNSVEQIVITPNKLFFATDAEKNETLNIFNKLKTDEDILYSLCSNIENEQDVPLEFLLNTKAVPAFNLDVPIVVINKLQFETSFNVNCGALTNIIDNIFKTEKTKTYYKNSLKNVNLAYFYKNFGKNLVFFDNATEKESFKNCKYFNFETKQFDSFLLHLDDFYNSIKPYLNKKIYLCLSSASTLNSVKTIFQKQQIPFSTNKNKTGLILTELNLPFNICFLDSDVFYIGSTNFAHKKTAQAGAKTTVKYLPKAGEYVVHAVHGIGKCEGVVSMKVEGAEKEFFNLTYKGGTLYVPCENADCLSLYMAENGGVALNKLGGKEFGQLKLKASHAIEDMSKELLELYAKRKASKGFKYDEDDYLYTEFESAFPYTETADQLLAIADVKKDMVSGKVMDRLICGDVGFGKTEVAMRAMFKAVEQGKQVAILAPTTILSLQHYKTVCERTKDFGVRVEMLNRFKTAKQQKEIIKNLKEHKIDVVCGTHRLVSEDVGFDDLGLLILDEEQRFGVKAKEKIKNLKHNVDVLTLSATPIPRTLSMSLMNIRDISIINTPPVNRLPVKTYVLEYNQNIIANAINDEIARGGQVLVVFNNIERIYAFKQTLEKAVNNPKANFDVAHGQMTEYALEKAIEHLYNRETNVLVSTTLIENGIDLPKANTLIVIESDHLGLSQMYQLRGRVGRSGEQAYAYFTFAKNKVLSEEASNRLQALAENTELGSGYKIAMRDLQIRGAGELLGKVQHGHMVKIGYEMYTRLLNDTIKRLQGQVVNVEREVKIEIALSSLIPRSFVDNESERLKIIAKISNIKNKTEAKELLNQMIVEYGKLPKEIYQLTNVAIIRALAIKQNIKNITLNNKLMQIVYYEDVNLPELIKKVQKFPNFRFVNGKLPTLVLDSAEMSVVGAQNYVIEFLHS